MSLLRQIKELKSEYETLNSHVLRTIIRVHGGVPDAPLRRTLLPGWLIIGGLPDTHSYTPAAGTDVPEQTEPEQVLV